MLSIQERIAAELDVGVNQVAAAVGLLDDGATVPFVARYRKEVTGGLDDVQLRALEQRLGYLRELEDRREAIVKSITEQGKMTPALEAAIREADSKARLEDLYLPYKPRRRTKGQIAREAGIEPLAELLLTDPTRDPVTEAAAFLNAEAGFTEAKAVLDGARHILMERFAEDAELVGRVRRLLREDGQLQARVVEGKEAEGAKFADYFAHSEPLAKVPSHRALAMFRGRNEGVLYLAIDLPGAAEMSAHPCEGLVAAHAGIGDKGRPADAWLMEVARWTWRVRLSVHVVGELLTELREAAEAEAIRVFAANLRDLLLAAPAGHRACIGLDPGLRTGVKVVALDGTGKLLEYTTIYPHVPQNKWRQSLETLAALARKHGSDLVAIGNGTASRETEKLAAELIATHPELGLTRVVVSEAGASVYSASELASQEFPDVDVSIRGAISIGRRLQDPLAELVKIEPKSIGVGQYQHDLNQLRLSRSLDAVVEDCVNSVGVELNSASAALLSRVSGLGGSLAQAIVAHRDQHGPFRSRAALRQVPRLGARTFEQCAGFLRVARGDNPLDASAVHPESYPVVERIAAAQGCSVSELIGNAERVRGLDPCQFVTAQAGELTVRDILRELEKPGRDPRPEFRTATFKEGVEELKHLQPGMVLEGTVTNVANFGAFVDVGVHQDGLVHVSALSNRFVKDPREVVKAGDVVKVKVLEVDIARKRIGLTMRLDDEVPAEGAPRQKRGSARPQQPVRPNPPQQPRRDEPRGNAPRTGTLGELLLAAQKRQQ
ncbi:MAG: RNA-binding transcriptional accessory protein [Pseudomonadales bacterium]|nr:RNA-binding transcriptional accessory protein [Pseudomonadales bacterium]MBP9032278.1 RNA-binding transcriptional accessory protein [Pseudomonadales bacterium]